MVVVEAAIDQGDRFLLESCSTPTSRVWTTSARSSEGGQFYGVNYLQSVTPALALGGEGFYLGSRGKSGVGFAARYADDKTVATGQVATTGLLSLTYCLKVSEKAMLATDFLWNWNQRSATASVGYDYILRQCRIRGRIDNHGVVSAFLEERINVGLNLILSPRWTTSTRTTSLVSA